MATGETLHRHHVGGHSLLLLNVQVLDVQERIIRVTSVLNTLIMECRRVEEACCSDGSDPGQIFQGGYPNAVQSGQHRYRWHGADRDVGWRISVSVEWSKNIGKLVLATNEATRWMLCMHSTCARHGNMSVLRFAQGVRVDSEHP